MADAVPTQWAGGRQVCVPEVGVGHLVMDEPRVICIELPAPGCVVVADGHDGTRVVVLVDPRVPYERMQRTIAAARLLEETAAADALLSALDGDLVVDPTPTPPTPLRVLPGGGALVVGGRHRRDGTRG